MSDAIDVRLLFPGYASGEITLEQLHALEVALRADAELRREFMEYLNVDSALGDLAALSAAEVAGIEAAGIEDNSTLLLAGDSKSRIPSVAKLRNRSRRTLVLGALAASLLLGLILWTGNPFTSKRPTVATLVTGVDAALLHGGQSWSDSNLPAGEYHLEQGLLHLQFAGGVMVYVEAPARFEAVSNKRVVLHSGRLSASVPPAGIGFTIETPEAEVVDYGTEFSVEAQMGSSEVHVFEGLVRVHSRHGNNDKKNAIDLRTAQAIRIEDSPQSPVKIELATERFIRSFDEPKRNYARVMKGFGPLAYYRMSIRDRGLAAEPPEYSGIVLTGDGIRPPHAHGMFAGGSLQVGGDSTGRGGRVDSPPPLVTGKFTLAVFVFLESQADEGVVATNIRGDQGNFRLSLDEHSRLKATVRDHAGALQSVTLPVALPIKTWRHLVVTADGESLQIYEDGQPVASSPCSKLATTESATLWFGTNADGSGLWNGRIDELALFDRALSDNDIAELYLAAQKQMAKSE